MRDRLLVSYGLGLLGLATMLILVRWLSGGWEGFWLGLIDKLFAAVVLAMIGLVWYRLLYPRSGFAEDLEIVEPWNNAPKLDGPLRTTKAYWFRGRSGRWFRNFAIPALSNAASQDQVTRVINIILPDPSDDTVLKAYADHRTSLRVLSVQRQLVSTWTRVGQGRGGLRP